MTGKILKSLADGQLGSTKDTLYTAGTSTSSLAKKITLFNTSSSEVTIKLYFKASGGTSRGIPAAVLGDGESKVLDDLALEEGDIIEGEADSANVIDYVISGVEIT